MLWAFLYVAVHNVYIYTCIIQRVISGVYFDHAPS